MSTAASRNPRWQLIASPNGRRTVATDLVEALAWQFSLDDSAAFEAWEMIVATLDYIALGAPPQRTGKVPSEIECEVVRRHGLLRGRVTQPQKTLILQLQAERKRHAAGSPERARADEMLKVAQRDRRRLGELAERVQRHERREAATAALRRRKASERG